ncbi:hypothetical protein PF010_g471 [Phytophthora fragariae]|nr:hypothetical protein PF009_g519 [Phytophthora fragariae]KAE9139735.1 hypothetical protein PF010_g471 [Phytophthora fragariae]KAE9155744.1 hypothetical protein PF006_g353 [Phytophthora fragariae]KAE9255779.1 hypothetical protein PF004_g431 [Phytophthora fragariae]KAE9257851.1 hypothetical protein PF002_g666 [Phytophthora fragariae]
MTRITATDAAVESKSRLGSQWGTDNTGNGRTEERHTGESTPTAPRQRARTDANQKHSTAGSVNSVDSDPPIGLVVALFHDGFVCRHVNKENEGVEGFAQPYDAESSYFLACIDNGRVPEGLPDMIACAHYNGSVLTEIQDYREMRKILCPVSSAFLPAASAMPQANGAELDPNFRVWQTLLQPGKSPLPIHAQVSPLFEPPTLQSMFDHFPDVTPSELETLAMDAKRQLLQEEDVLLSSSSTESSSPREDSRGFGFFPAETQDSNRNEGVAGSTTTPTTRSRLYNGLEASPPASLLSPIERKSARSSLNRQEDNSTKWCKRKSKESCAQKENRNLYEENVSLKVESTNTTVKSDYGGSEDQDMEVCGSPRYFRSQQSRRSYSDLLAEDSASVTPLPATQLFLSKLKGKRRRPETELLYGKPAWVTIAHVGRFFRAATRLEREHSRFLHANAQRLMQAEKTPPQETEHIAGSMRYLARQLGDLTRPSDVIAVAGAHELKLAEDEGRELHEPDWMDNGERSPLPVWGSAESAIALVTPDSDPALHLQRIDNDDDIMLGHFFELTTDTASLIKDYQPTAAAPHFNAFDDDGNLQLQSA